MTIENKYSTYVEGNRRADVIRKNGDWGCKFYEDKWGSKCYKVYVLDPCDTSQTLFPWVDGERTGFWGTALAHDLGSLRHLQEYL